MLGLKLQKEPKVLKQKTWRGIFIPLLIWAGTKTGQRRENGRRWGQGSDSSGTMVFVGFRQTTTSGATVAAAWRRQRWGARERIKRKKGRASEGEAGDEVVRVGERWWSGVAECGGAASYEGGGQGFWFETGKRERERWYGAKIEEVLGWFWRCFSGRNWINFSVSEVVNGEGWFEEMNMAIYSHGWAQILPNWIDEIEWEKWVIGWFGLINEFSLKMSLIMCKKFILS